MRLDQDYPQLEQFLGGYLHQDWPEDYGSWEAAIDAFAAEEPAERVEQAVGELRELLRRMPDEEALGRTLYALGCYYDPTPDGLPRRAWLEQVAARLAERPWG